VSNYLEQGFSACCLQILVSTNSHQEGQWTGGVKLTILWKHTHKNLQFVSRPWRPLI